ncbi:US12A [Papio ursinus cytomegalovirus]|uniref:US12A n=1 Tax=Papiine betaherpesvirus 4 TaxID=2560624 RepID=A0A0F7GB50_9BETA|nr:US12A [Papio ursinus cytomegalovirus]AKG51557.1 US12A [Papiine betaherpesvirus 4]
MEVLRFQVRFTESIIWIQRFKILIQLYSYWLLQVTVTSTLSTLMWLAYPQWQNLCQTDPAPILIIIIPVLNLACLVVRWEKHASDLLTMTGYVFWITSVITLFGFCVTFSTTITAHIASVVLFAMVTCGAFFERGGSGYTRRYALAGIWTIASVAALLIIACASQSSNLTTHIMLSVYVVFLTCFIILNFWVTQQHQKHLHPEQLIRGALTLYVMYFVLFQVTLLMLNSKIWDVSFSKIFSSFTTRNATVS